MAEKLLKYYKYVSEEKGIMGKMELAKITKIPSTIAASHADDPNTINTFKAAVQKITGKPAPSF